MKREISEASNDGAVGIKRSYYTTSWAVLVGISDYKGHHPPLLNARNDAKSFAYLLKENYGFQEVHTLFDVQATRSNIAWWLKDALPEKTKKNDQVIIFFAGHGLTQTTANGGVRGYLVPYDATPNRYGDFIDMEDLQHACSLIKAKHILIILDCCFSGVAAVTSRAPALITKSEITGTYIDQITQRSAWQILTAGSSDELASDGGLRSGHSAFTGVLLQGLGGDADTDKDGLITASELAHFIKPRVSMETSRGGREGQTPFFGYMTGSGQGEFVFVNPKIEHVVGESGFSIQNINNITEGKSAEHHTAEESSNLDSGVRRVKSLVNLLKRFGALSIFLLLILIIFLPLVTYRVPKTYIDLELIASEIGFTVADSGSAIGDLSLMSFRALGFQPTDIFLYSDKGTESKEPKRYRISENLNVTLTTPATTSSSNGLTLSDLTLQAGDKVFIKVINPTQFQLVLVGANIETHLDFEGPLKIAFDGEPGFSNTNYDSVIPNRLHLESANATLHLLVEPEQTKTDTIEDLFNRLHITALEFTTPKQDGHESTVIDGTLYREGLQRKIVNLSVGDRLFLSGVDGELRSVKIQDGEIKLRYFGQIGDLKKDQLNLMPSYLEAVYMNYTAFFWIGVSVVIVSFISLLSLQFKLSG